MTFIEGILILVAVGWLLGSIDGRPTGLRLGANSPPPRHARLVRIGLRRRRRSRRGLRL